MASILVTGASRGIGRAACVSLGRAGHRVFATMRDPASASELRAITSAESLPISLSAMDVDSDEWGAADDAAWYARVERDFGLDARGGGARAPG